MSSEEKQSLITRSDESLKLLSQKHVTNESRMEELVQYGQRIEAIFSKISN